MMLSLTKTLSSFPCQLRAPCQHRSIICSVIRSNANDGSELKSSEPVRPPDGVEIRFKRGSRRRRRLEEEEEESGVAQRRKAAVVKDWDSMSLSEKAVELYVGEKGMLFWLNKFAYASIFIVIGGWIIFRFVGPALNLYQLDAPPLPPTSMLKGS